MNKNEVSLIWHINYWDGPLAGLCLFNDRICYFRMVEEAEEIDCPRRFNILSLSDSQIAEFERRHALFRKYVGVHCDYDENGNRSPRKVKPIRFHDKFYKDPSIVPNVLTGNEEVIGHFER